MQIIDLLTDAYRLSGIIAENATPSAEQGQIGVTRLNDLMATLAEDGIDLGYAPASTTTDELFPPLGYVGGIKALLAVKLFTQYMGGDVPAAIAEEADRGYQRMLGRAVSMQIERAQSNTLPAGQNQRYGYNILTG